MSLEIKNFNPYINTFKKSMYALPVQLCKTGTSWPLRRCHSASEEI